jgi:gamma-glutamyltranspeptidase/glutathione hydrolase
MRNFENPGRSCAVAANAMAATSSPSATLAAIEALKAGGNAVDAAITASAVLCVAEPHMTGIGGDCFALVGMPDGKVHGLNGSGRSAMAATPEWLAASGLSSIESRSIHAVTVPGAIDAWSCLLDRFGTMTLGQALAPAIALAEKGLATGPRTAFDWQFELDVLVSDEGGRRHYLKDGHAPLAGESMSYPALARTLRTIADGGRDAFYAGPLAKDMVDCLQKHGSLLTLEDFAATGSSWVDPISTDFAGTEVLELPPNGQGLTVLIALNILNHFGLKSHDPHGSARRHLEIEAIKLAWELRNRHIADPDFADIPSDDLLSPKMSAKLAGMISQTSCLDIRAALPSSDTVYLTVVDKNRMAVSFINSIYWSFGSGIVTPESGITFQNRGAGFVTTPGHPNCIGPAKRPLHTIIPAMTRKDGRIGMSFGVMGGNYQPMGHVTVLVNRLIYGMDPQEALDFPRCHSEDGNALYESTMPPKVLEDLGALGHRIVPSPDPLGGGQIIDLAYQNGTLWGGSDHRKDGLALGY